MTAPAAIPAVTVVKIGGSLLEPAPPAALWTALARRITGGERLVLVHGGGPALTALLGRLAIPTRFHHGLRITGAETLEAALMVLAGSVNKTFVASLNAALRAAAPATHRRAVGLTGLDGDGLRARIVDPELGRVGAIAGGDARVLQALLAADFIPVLASIAGDDAGPLNINADSFAAACATLLAASRLVFLTDVPGVRDAAGRVCSELGLDEAAAAVASGAITAGMMPKIAACQAALEAGVAEVVIQGLAAFHAGAIPGGTRLRAGRAQPPGGPTHSERAAGPAATRRALNDEIAEACR